MSITFDRHIYHPSHGTQAWPCGKLLTVKIARCTHDPNRYFWITRFRTTCGSAAAGDIKLNERVSLRRPFEILSSIQSRSLASAAPTGHVYRAIRGRC